LATIANCSDKILVCLALPLQEQPQSFEPVHYSAAALLGILILVYIVGGRNEIAFCD
jgi:hypothetical protein